MEKRLAERFWDYIIENNPDLMFRLQDEYRVMDYLKERVSKVMPMAHSLKQQGMSDTELEERCLEELCRELRPSRYAYLRQILADDFPECHQRMRECGTLTYEILKMMEACAPLFEEMDFNQENEGDEMIRMAVTGNVYAYLEGQEVIG